MADDWAPYERAWAEDPHSLPHRVCLPELIAEADRAVAAAVVNLSREYDAAISCQSRHALTAPCATWAEQESALVTECNANAPHGASIKNSDCGQYCISATESSTLHDWWQLYRSLCFIQAPMVRCSRPAFRQVCRAWGTRISYTHMIIAESFVKSPHARHAEFARYEGEDRLVVQLAAKSGPSAAQAALLLRPYCDGIDLNCGCPQRWAMKEGIGASLLDRPEQVADMVQCIRNAMPDGNTAPTVTSNGTGEGSNCAGTAPPFLPCAVKMRIKTDLRHSVDFARQCEAAGASWLTVHGRSPTCHPSAPVQFEAVKLIRENLSVPVVLNGGVTDVSTAMEAALRTKCGGLMAANGLLDNPAMFYCGVSRAALKAEMSFATSSGERPPQTYGDMSPTEEAVAPEASTESFSPVRPVSFLWAPDRSSADAMLLQCTVPDMWQASVTPREVISDFMRAAIRTDLTVPTTVQQVLRIARLYVSPAERNHFALLRSNLSVLNALQQIGVYVENGRITCE
ncbi:hypothetical protein JKF63_01721 [Porcisia hertigi]|uniref:DUS-like FMN-binding domain-containing protein n=1 Tax=Porcisia hertigi TaxID=2761500 RepID=A0A836HJI8_9TRYP|nr:hypothetical protein JKF63_01721 [Porcisia hertigi]